MATNDDKAYSLKTCLASCDSVQFFSNKINEGLFYIWIFFVTIVTYCLHFVAFNWAQSIAKRDVVPGVKSFVYGEISVVAREEVIDIIFGALKEIEIRDPYRAARLRLFVKKIFIVPELKPKYSAFSLPPLKGVLVAEKDLINIRKCAGYLLFTACRNEFWLRFKVRPFPYGIKYNKLNRRLSKMASSIQKRSLKKMGYLL